MPREGGASSTPRLLDSITDISGILDRPPSRAMTVEGEADREWSVIARSEATKQSILPFCGAMDCFASLAMTGIDMIYRSRGAVRPSCAGILSPHKIRGRREGRVLAGTRGLVCNKRKKNAHEHTGISRGIRPSLRNGFTAYAVLSPETNSSCLRRRRIGGSHRPVELCKPPPA